VPLAGHLIEGVQREEFCLLRQGAQQNGTLGGAWDVDAMDAMNAMFLWLPRG
jgi:hypothetical protein